MDVQDTGQDKMPQENFESILSLKLFQEEAAVVVFRCCLIGCYCQFPVDPAHEVGGHVGGDLVGGQLGADLTVWAEGADLGC